MGGFVVDLEDVDGAMVAVVGGKGAQLGELRRIDGVRVPAGFCVTTDAFRRAVAGTPSLAGRIDGLAHLDPDDRSAIAIRSAAVRRAIEEATIPEDVASAVTGSVVRLGDQSSCAVRSSSTVEDLSSASSAGQYDTYLNVVGPAAVLRHVSRCWASLYTERAVAYRLRHGAGDQPVLMAVVVQRLVGPRAAGVLFTADPVTSNRKVAVVEAVPGLGEALVAGRADADRYTVRDGRVVARVVAAKRHAVRASPGGGTGEVAIRPERRVEPSLADGEVVQLTQLGRRIEAHLGRPQDIEWCLVDDGFEVVQSRPITTLFPVPEAEDGENHVYVSVGHQQMMTDPMRPLGLSVWQLTARRPMVEAGGRLFVDVTRELGSPSVRDRLLEALGTSDPLIGDALWSVLDRPGFIPAIPDETPPVVPGLGPPSPLGTDPAVVAGLIGRSRASLAQLRRDLPSASGPAVFDAIVDDIGELRKILFDPQSLQVIMAAMEASSWLNERVEAWLGDTLSRSVPGNVTSAMGLALLDVADVIRPHPEVVAFLHHVGDGDLLGGLPGLTGGREARDAILTFLDTYGMRCVGEIDITRPRWSERPDALVPLLVADVQNFEAGAGTRRFERGLREAQDKEREVLTRLRDLPDGERKATETAQMIDRLRTFAGYREYPKFHMVSRYFVYKQALTEVAGDLVRARVLGEVEDAFYLTLPELRDVARTHRADDGLIRRRREDFRSYRALTPPRVVTSDGEVVTGTYGRTDAPDGALVGLPVSSGVVEGRARVIADLAGADLHPGDILVTTYTDPSWTPAFVGIAGLVTEVGGLMTHGAVIAREYGLPAVVGVEHATRSIADGQRIRVDGTGGYVERLPGDTAAPDVGVPSTARRPGAGDGAGGAAAAPAGHGIRDQSP